MRIGMVIMSILGIAPLIVRIFEFPALNVSWDSNAYGSVVWILLGLHTTHIITDLMDTLVLARADVHTARSKPEAVRRRPGQRHVLELCRRGVASDLWLHLLAGTAMSASKLRLSVDPPFDLGGPVVRGVGLGREHAAWTDPALFRLPFADSCLGHSVVRWCRTRRRFGPDVVAISAPHRRRCRRAGQYCAFRERRKRAVRDALHLRPADAGRCIVGAERMRKIVLSTVVLLVPRAAHWPTARRPIRRAGRSILGSSCRSAPSGSCTASAGWCWPGKAADASGRISSASRAGWRWWPLWCRRCTGWASASSRFT